jgi:hypothetical protein
MCWSISTATTFYIPRMECVLEYSWCPNICCGRLRKKYCAHSPTFCLYSQQLFVCTHIRSKTGTKRTMATRRNAIQNLLLFLALSLVGYNNILLKTFSFNNVQNNHPTVDTVVKAKKDSLSSTDLPCLVHEPHCCQKASE